MTNPWTGEVALTVDGQRCRAKLTLGALAALEADLSEDSLVALIRRFEEGRFSTTDLARLLVHGLAAGGWDGDAEALMAAEIEGGVMAAVTAAGALLARSFGTDG